MNKFIIAGLIAVGIAPSYAIAVGKGASRAGSSAARPEVRAGRFLRGIQLIRAAEANDEARALELLSRGVDTNSLNEALIHATNLLNYRLIDELLNRGARPEARNARAMGLALGRDRDVLARMLNMAHEPAIIDQLLIQAYNQMPVPGPETFELLFSYPSTQDGRDEALRMFGQYMPLDEIGQARLAPLLNAGVTADLAHATAEAIQQEVGEDPAGLAIVDLLANV